MNPHSLLRSLRLVLLTGLLGFSAAAQTGPAITKQPAVLSRSLGDKATLSVTATGDAPLSYQWQLNGSPVTNATNRTLNLTNLTTALAGNYTVVVSNDVSAVTSEPATLDVDTTFQFVTSTPITKEGGHGVAWADYDGDGRLDLLATGSSKNSLFHNDGNGVFTKITTGNPVVSRTFGTDNVVNSQWVDFDNDGLPDVFVPTGFGAGEERDQLFRNLGNGQFVVTTNALTQQSVANTSVAWGDFNQDGRLDVFLANYRADNTRPNQLWFGSEEKGLALATNDFPSLTYRSFGSAVSDYDGDGDLDIAVGVNPGGQVILYENQGGGQFEAFTLPGSSGSFIGGPLFGDYDNDGQPDLFVSYASGFGGLFHNEGGGEFVRVTGDGLPAEPGRSIGAFWGDYDNDGWLDLFIPRQSGYAGDSDNHDSLWRNNADGTFTRIPAGSVGQDGVESTGAAWGDYDNDGFLDLVVSVTGSNRLYRNGGNANGWLTLKLVGAASNRDAIGAKIKITTWDGNLAGKTRAQYREVGTGSGWGGQNDPRVHFGLGDATQEVTVKIEWPSGKKQTLRNVAMQQILTVVEGAPRLRVTSDGVLHLEGDPNTSYAMESSSNLTGWMPRPDLGVTTDGTGYASVDVSTGASGDSPSVIFLRARVP